MGGKKKKGKKKGDDKPSEPPQLIIPDFTPKDIEPLPLSVKVRHYKDLFIIYTDEYHRSIEIKERFSKIINKPVENIRLYLQNKRQIEDETTNHDQQVKNETILFAVFKKDEGNEWENVNEILHYDPNKPVVPTEQK